MKRFFAGLIALALAGCNDTATTGGPAARDTNRGVRDSIGQPENTFTIDVPNLATRLNQGEAKTISISLNRGKNFSEDVALKFDNVPPGVTLDPSTITIKAGDTRADISVKAADDAALGDHTITVTGQPTRGEAATNKFQVKISTK